MSQLAKKKAISLKIAGITPLTTIDYPDHLSLVVYCQGCNWRCRYCHNPEMLSTRTAGAIEWDDLSDTILARKNFIDAVVFSGGEATLQSALFDAMAWVKQQGLKVGLHTGGANPEKLSKLLPFVDWVGFDVKGMQEQVDDITQVVGAGEKNWRSLQLVLDSGVDYECRTTVHWDLMSAEQLMCLGNCLHAYGVSNFTVQLCRDEVMLDTELPYSFLPEEEKKLLWRMLEDQFQNFKLR